MKRFKAVPDNSEAGGSSRRFHLSDQMARIVSEATEPFTTTEVGCVQRSQRKLGDTLIHELRLVVRRPNQARQTPPRALGVVGAQVRLNFWWVHRCRYAHTSQSVPWTLISRNFYGPRLVLRLRREKISRALGT